MAVGIGKPIGIRNSNNSDMCSICILLSNIDGRRSGYGAFSTKVKARVKKVYRWTRHPIRNLVIFARNVLDFEMK